MHSIITYEWSRSSPSELFLGKGALKKCSQFIGEHPSQSAVSIKLFSSFIQITFDTSVGLTPPDDHKQELVKI